MRAIDLAVPLLLFGTAACATDSAVEQELSQLRRQMHGLQKEVQKQRLEIERLEGRVTLMSLGAEPARAEPIAPVSSQNAIPAATVRPERGPERALPVVRMAKRADAAGNDVVVPWEDPGAQDDGSPPVMIKLGPSPTESTPSERLSVDRSVLKKPDPVLSAPKEERDRPRRKTNKRATRAQIREAYDAALTLLRDGKDPAGALVRFEAFVDDFPKSRLADNAMYWAGECQLALEKWSAAAVTFGRLLRSYPRSAKVPYAKVGLGRSRIELGDRAKGESLLREVIERYPTSEAANEASALLGAKESE